MLTEEQHEIRRTRISASDVPIILGMVEWSTPWRLWAEKKGLVQRQESAEHMVLGEDLENSIVSIGSRRNALYDVFNPKMTFIHPKQAWACATPDSLAHEQRAENVVQLVGVEAKFVPFNIDKWKGGLPDYVEAQARWQLFVSELERCYVFGLVGGKFVTHVVDRDEAVERDLVAAMHAWYLRHIANGEEPAKTLADLKSTPKNFRTAATVAADGHAETAARELLTVREEIKALEQREKVLLSSLALKANDGAKLVGQGWSAKWYEGRTMTDWKALAATATPEQIKLHTTKSEPYFMVRKGK